MADAATNPLNNFKSAPTSSGDLKLPQLPSAKTLVQANGLMAGLEQFDRQAEEWRRNVERLINERLKDL